MFENGLSAIHALNVLLFQLANRIISVFTTNVVPVIVTRAQRQTITNTNTIIKVRTWVARMPHIVFNLGETCDPNPLSFEADVCACRPPKARYILSAGDRVQLHLEEVHLHLGVDFNQAAVGVLVANHVGLLPGDCSCVVEEEASHIDERGVKPFVRAVAGDPSLSFCKSGP